MEFKDSVTILDENGDPRIILSARSKLSTIMIRGDDRAEVLLEAGGGRTAVRFRDATAADSLLVGADDDGAAVVVRDKDSRNIIKITVNRNTREATCTLQDADGRELKRMTFAP